MPESQEHTETLTLTYESNVHRADAKAIGASILTIQAMIDEVQDAFKENERILLKARPFAQGSLELPLDLIILGAAVVLHEYPLLQKIREVITQYFDIKKRLRGKPVQVKEGNVLIIENSSVHVDEITLHFLDPGGEVSKRCSEAFHAIEKDPDINAVSVSTSASSKPLAHVSRQEFNYYHPDIPISEQNLGTQEERSRETLIIRQPAFDADLAWRFVWHGTKISARILHEEFQKRVEEGQESFVAGDSLDVDLHRLQEYDPNSLTYIDKQYTITHVWKHNQRTSEKQGKLFE